MAGAGDRNVEPLPPTRKFELNDFRLVRTLGTGSLSPTPVIALRQPFNCTSPEVADPHICRDICSSMSGVPRWLQPAERRPVKHQVLCHEDPEEDRGDQTQAD